MWDYNEDEVIMEDYDADITEDGMDADDDFSETDVLEADAGTDEEAYDADGPVDDFVGGSSVVFDVDDLVAEFEAEGMEDSSAASRLRRRLEAIQERKRRHDDLADFADYDLDA